MNPLTSLKVDAGPAFCPLPTLTLEDATQQARMARFGVDLSRYPSLSKQEYFEPITSPINRMLTPSIIKAFTAQAFNQTPNPVMLTHIVTTRCNYSCHFCSFADTLNAKTNELSLEEITQAYKTIGDNLNVIVYSGGETTLNKQLPDIIEAAYRHTPVQSVYIISNAWKPELIFQMTHQVLQRCPELHLTWSLSIEGPKAFNNKVRHTQQPNWDAWQNTIDTMFGLQAMRQRFGYAHLNVQLCTVCSPDNYAILDDWYETIKRDLRPDKWNLNLMRRSVQMSGHTGLASFAQRRRRRPRPRPQQQSQQPHSPFEPHLEPFEQKYVQLVERIRQDVLSGQLRFLYNTKGNPADGAMKSAVDLISQDENCRVVLEKPAGLCCKAGTMGAYIGSDGTVSGCEEFANHPTEAKAFGNLRHTQGDFQAIWQSKTARQHRKHVGQATECHGCTLESQKNYPTILVSFKPLLRAWQLSRQIH